MTRHRRREAALAAVTELVHHMETKCARSLKPAFCNHRKSRSAIIENRVL